MGGGGDMLHICLVSIGVQERGLREGGCSHSNNFLVGQIVLKSRADNA